MKKFITLILILHISLFSQFSFAVTDSGSSSTDEQYVPIDPPLIVNISDGQTLRFMQVSAQFKVSNAESANVINTHISAIRHTMLMLLGNQAIRDVYTTRGKEKLRKQCLVEVKKVLDDYTDTNSIENIYFTSFIIQ